MTNGKVYSVLGMSSDEKQQHPQSHNTHRNSSLSARALKDKFKQKIREIDTNMKLSKFVSTSNHNTPSNSTPSNNSNNNTLSLPQSNQPTRNRQNGIIGPTATSNDSNAEEMNPLNADKEALKKSLLHVVIGQPKSVRRKGSVFQRIYSRVTSWNDKNRNAFLNYSNLLKKCISEQEECISKYQNELHQCKKTMTIEIKKWKRWAQNEAQNMARTYYENKYMLLSTQIEIAMARLQVLESMFNKVTFVLDGGSLEAVKNELLIPFFGTPNLGPNATPINGGNVASPPLTNISEMDPLELNVEPMFPSDELMPDYTNMLDNNANEKENRSGSGSSGSGSASGNGSNSSSKKNSAHSSPRFGFVCCVFVFFCLFFFVCFVAIGLVFEMFDWLGFVLLWS